MQVKLVNIDEVKPYEGNPRVNDPAVDAVAASLREFAFRQPIVVDGRNIYEPETMKAIGFTYRGMGRGYDG